MSLVLLTPTFSTDASAIVLVSDVAALHHRLLASLEMKATLVVVDDSQMGA